MKDPMKYGKAKGIVLLQKYLPDINPFKDVTIIDSIEEWNAVKDRYGDFVAHRIDYPIGSAKKNAVPGTSGFTNSIPDVIKKVKQQSPDGVILLMSTKEPSIPRYENDGGFNVLFHLGEEIIIEIVGKGFDAHEITQGLAVHERYQIPWDEILFMKDRTDLLKSRTVFKTLVSPQNYTKQREERLKFLEENCHYDIIKSEESVPEQYSLVSDSLISCILNDVIFELMKKQSSLRRDGLKRFAVQGNLVHGRVQPWEIFREDTLLTKEVLKKEADFER